MITENRKAKYMQILAELNKRNANFCTQKELSVYLKVSVRKISSFVNGETFDFWLLCRYGDLLGKEIRFEINNI